MNPWKKLPEGVISSTSINSFINSYDWHAETLKRVTPDTKTILPTLACCPQAPPVLKSETCDNHPPLKLPLRVRKYNKCKYPARSCHTYTHTHMPTLACCPHCLGCGRDILSLCPEPSTLTPLTRQDVNVCTKSSAPPQCHVCQGIRSMSREL